MKQNARSWTPWLVFITASTTFPFSGMAQGTLYVSSLATGGRYGYIAVDNNSWVAEEIESGNDPNGYVFDSINLSAGSIPGASGFGVSIYSDLNNQPGSLLTTLSGTSDPTDGVYTYTAAGLSLASSTEYFVVATAPASSSQPFELTSGTGSSATGVNQWMIGGVTLDSGDQGADWSTAQGVSDVQMAVYATAVPEPSTWALFIGGGAVMFFISRRKIVSVTSL